MVDGGAAADAAQQPRPRGRRASRGARRLRRLRARPRATTTRCARSSARCSTLGDDETLLVQSGKPVGVFRTHPGAPRVLIANSLLVPRWATWDEFRRLEALGLTMFGQMTAGSWIYIGTQGILQGTYQTFGAAGEKHFGSRRPRGRTILTAGLGGMGGAQPLAATLAGAAILCVEVDPSRIERRLETRYLDEATDSLDDALARVRAARARAGRSRSACSATRPRSCPSWRGAASTSTSSPTRRRRTIRSRATCRRASRRGGRGAARGRPRRVPAAAPASRSSRHVEGMLEYVRAGSYVFDYGNNLRGEATEGRRSGRLHIPGLRPGLYPAALLPRHRARSAGRRSRAIRPTSRRSTGAAGALPRRRAAAALARARARAGRVPGPARADLLARLRRPRPRRARDQRARPERSRSRRRS